MLPESKNTKQTIPVRLPRPDSLGPLCNSNMRHKTHMKKKGKQSDCFPFFFISLINSTYAYFAFTFLLFKAYHRVPVIHTEE